MKNLTQKEITILISERNPNIRKLLQRELVAAGYRVILARNGEEVMKSVDNLESLDLLILDSDISDISASTLQRMIRDRVPSLPVIVHGYDDISNGHLKSIDSVFIEKGSNSIEELKKMAFHLTRKL